MDALSKYFIREEDARFKNGNLHLVPVFGKVLEILLNLRICV